MKGLFNLKIAIIGGTGDQGLGLALRFVKAGEDVIVGSRDLKKAETAVDLMKDILGSEDLPNLTAMTNQDAASNGDIIILTVPLQAQMVTLKSIKDNLKGEIFVDATSPLEGCLGGKPTRYVDLWEGSAAERSAEFLGDNAVVVSAFCNISASSLTTVEEDVECDCLVSGDDHEANLIVMELAEKISGVKSIECGALENARIVEKLTPLLINLNIRNKVKNAGIRISNI
jgi:8-hydroxy-5-deazaflavin:NADPH oxidoreductase